MSFFNFRKSDSDGEFIEDPDLLLEALLEKHGAGERAAFRALAWSHRQMVGKHFPSWAVVPYHMQSDAALSQAYLRALLELADYLARKGDSTVVEFLNGGGDNPLARWDRAFVEFEEQMKAFDFAAARDVLLGVVEEMRELKGPSAEMRKPYVHERLAWLFFLTGDYESAELHGRTAMAGFEHLGMEEGLLMVSRRLADIFKAAGDREAFVRWMTMHTNILVERGLPDNAKAIRQLNGIEPLEGIIPLED